MEVIYTLAKLHVLYIFMVIPGDHWGFVILSDRNHP